MAGGQDSLIDQLVKNLPAMQETWVQFLGQEDPLDKGLAIHPSGLPVAQHKESACNAADPASIPGSGRSPGEEIGYPLQYSWSSLVVQLVKNLPAMQETWVQSLGWEDPLEVGVATHSSILAWIIPMDREAWQATIHGVPKSQT